MTLKSLPLSTLLLGLFLTISLPALSFDNTQELLEQAQIELSDTKLQFNCPDAEYTIVKTFIEKPASLTYLKVDHLGALISSSTEAYRCPQEQISLTNYCVHVYCAKTISLTPEQAAKMVNEEKNYQSTDLLAPTDTIFK